MDSPERKLTLGVAMIARNEQEFIGRALDSVLGADQIVVVDTGSNDNGETVRIAKEHGAIVYEDYRWEDSFCKARNQVKSKMTTDWILSLDCDEFIHDFEAVRRTIAVAEKEGLLAVDILQVAESDGQLNTFPRVFKNVPEVVWHGDAHNYLSIVGTLIGEEPDGSYFKISPPYTKEQTQKAMTKLTYGYSLTHLADPDRTMRILEKNHKDGTAGARELYYLGREYYYRRRYQECTAILGKYVQLTRHLAEKAEAFLMMARCYWATQQPDSARDACAQAIVINPDFKEALMFMTEMSWPRQANRWRSFAELADNTDVLFNRT